MLKRACICVAILSFLVVMGLPIAQAQTAERRIKVNVPFEFNLRDHVLAAGEYEVRESAANGAVIIVRAADGSEQLIALTRDAEPKAGGARLVFRRYGEQYFLAAAWMDAGQGHTLLESRRERSLRKELAQSSHAVAPETVTVLAVNAAQ